MEVVMAKEQVRLLVALAGPRQSWQAGEVYECTTEEAKRLIAAGFAEPIAVDSATRAATKSAAPAKDRGNVRRGTTRR